jgi:hypothetical protein
MAKNQTPISFFNSFVILATSALITFLVVTFLPAAEEQAIPENILLGQEMCGKNRKGPVEFSLSTTLKTTDCHVKNVTMIIWIARMYGRKETGLTNAQNAMMHVKAMAM